MSDLRVLAACALLAAGISAAVSAAVNRFGAAPAPGIATVRLGEIAAAWAVKAAGESSPAETAAANARLWAGALETALRETAARHRVVLLPSRAVAAGAPDLTHEIEAALAGALAEPRTGGMDRSGEEGP